MDIAQLIALLQAQNRQPTQAPPASQAPMIPMQAGMQAGPPIMDFSALGSLVPQRQAPSTNPADPASWKTTVSPANPGFMARALQAFRLWDGV